MVHQRRGVNVWGLEGAWGWFKPWFELELLATGLRVISETNPKP